MTDRRPAAELAALRVPRSAESDAYRQAREALLAQEIEVRRQIGALAAQRRALPPGPVMETTHRFRDETGAEVGLADLFGAHDTLVTYFWMYGPQRRRPCPMCTNLLGPLAANAADLKQRVALEVLGRSDVNRQKAFAVERGWRDLTFVQVGDEFARHIGGLTEEGQEMPVFMVFRKDGDDVRLFYAGEMPRDAADPGEDPRGPLDFAPLWNVLDLTPAGRDPHWYPKLAYR